MAAVRFLSANLVILNGRCLVLPVLPVSGQKSSIWNISGVMSSIYGWYPALNTSYHRVRPREFTSAPPVNRIGSSHLRFGRSLRFQLEMRLWPISIFGPPSRFDYREKTVRNQVQVNYSASSKFGYANAWMGSRVKYREFVARLYIILHVPDGN